MKTRIFLMLLMVAALLFSCQKEKNEPVAGEQEVSFSATLVQPDLKNSEDLIPCSSEAPTHAHIVLAGDPQTSIDVEVYTIGTKLYTKAIKMDPGNYSIVGFLLYKETNGTPGYQNSTPADLVVYATPEANSTYEVYLTHTLPYSFTVTAFQKSEIDIEVLCFVDLLYQNFGFFWFDITEIIIREQCFFGDFCIKHAEDYAGSSYANQTGFPGTGFYDAPAIIQLIVEHKIGASWIGVPGSPFTNDNTASNWGVGAPVCIEYPDVVNQVDSFRVELKILVLVGSTPTFVSFHVWKFKDDQMIVPPAPDGDGVVDFVLGTCNLMPTDLNLPPYQNLPETATVKFTYPDPFGPGYWGIYVSSPNPSGTKYDVPIGANLPGWCGDNNVYLTPGTYTEVHFYGSLTDVNWPDDMPFSLGKIKMVNWLFNNITSFSGFSNGIVTDAQGLIVQDACWEILCPEGDFNAAGLAATMATAAEAHGDYMPLPGGWAAAIMVVNDLPLKYQLIFTEVDP